MIANPFTISLLLLIPHSVFSHGENKPGPHGGYIQMPGAFHTEVVPMGKNRARIYLLDMHWRNPSRKGSVEARIGKNAATCTPESDYFWCTFPKESDLSLKGTLVVRAEREGLKGTEVSYELPFQRKSVKPSHWPARNRGQFGRWERRKIQRRRQTHRPYHLYSIPHYLALGPIAA